MRVFIFLAVFLLLINQVSGVEIGASPSELTFFDSKDESCKEIKLMSDDKRLFNLNDKWNIISNSRSPVFYTSNGDEAGVVVNYEKQVIVNGFSMVNVCLKSVEKGKKQGILFFDSNGASLGVRIEVKSQENREIERKVGITGDVVNDNSEYDDLLEDNKLVLYLLLFDFVLFVVLIYLFYMLKRREV